MHACINTNKSLSLFIKFIYLHEYPIVVGELLLIYFAVEGTLVSV